MVHYSRGHVRQVLQGLNIEVRAKTEKRYNCLCPFHPNTDSPAFSISRSEGVWICFNEDCAERGNLEQLVMKVTDRSQEEAFRYIANKGAQLDEASLADILDEAFAGEPEWPHFPQQVVDELVSNFWRTQDAKEYMYGRGFNDDTLRRFQIGFSPKRGGEVTYPVYTPSGDLCVGVVGRGIASKFFDNSKNLPKNRLLFNLHDARRESSGVIVVESGFDAQRIHQAGFPNAVATLGSAVSQEQMALMERNFTDVLVFSDNDDAGMAMRKKIMTGVKSAAVLHCAWDYGKMYPDEGHNIPDSKEDKTPKDAGDLSIEQIQHMVNNPLTSYDVGLP